MARKPNYQFERMERERLKAKKTADKAAARAAARQSETDDAGAAAQDGGSDRAGTPGEER